MKNGCCREGQKYYIHVELEVGSWEVTVLSVYCSIVMRHGERKAVSASHFSREEKMMNLKKRRFVVTRCHPGNRMDIYSTNYIVCTP